MHANEDKISERVIACAFAVSNGLGAGFLEAVYQNALALELRSRKIVFESQKPINVSYRGCTVGQYVADFVIANQLVLEIKALSSLTAQREAQLLNYLKATGLTAGLLLNFGAPRVGVRRIVVAYDDRQPI